MLFGLGNKELENFIRDFAILRQTVGKRAGGENPRNGLARANRRRP